MPRRDGSGPFGMRPMTGRGFGPCGGYYHRPRFGRRSGHERGFRYYEKYPMDEYMENNLMEKQKAILEARLKNINDMLDELQNED